MYRNTILVGVLALALCASANAGVTNWSAQWVDSSPLDLSNGGTGWQWNPTTLEWNIWEAYIASDPDTATAAVNGEAELDPTIHIVKQVTNGSTFDWTDYHIVVTGSPGVSYVAHSATSDKFGTINESGNVIDFFAPQTVLMGQTVTFSLDIQIPEGLFSFNIDQTPTPEPSSMLLLGVTGLLIRRRRAI
jgi:hypothetical protein